MQNGRGKGLSRRRAGGLRVGRNRMPALRTSVFAGPQVVVADATVARFRRPLPIEQMTRGADEREDDADDNRLGQD